jgi:hypothetical protein
MFDWQAERERLLKDLIKAKKKWIKSCQKEIDDREELRGAENRLSSFDKRHEGSDD